MKKWLLFLIISSCKVSSFVTQVAPNTVFENYQTYALVDYPNHINITQPEYDNPQNRKLIAQAIKEELTVLGKTEEKENSDFLVAYTLLIRDMVDTRVDSAVIYKPWVDTKLDTFNYTEGAFTLILMDAKTRNIIAQSQMEGIMGRNPQKFKSSIPRMIKLMFKRIENESKASSR